MIIRLIYIAPIWHHEIRKYGKNDQHTEEEKYHVITRRIQQINRAGNVVIESTGAENLPDTGGYIMFPNHQGLFDPLALFETHRRPFSIVYKKELDRVFFIKDVVHLIKALPIDRENIRQSMEIILEMAKQVKSGRIFAIFPEGTRSRDGNKLIEFKNGSFKSAMVSKCPIVPVALIDSYKAFDTNSIKRIIVQVHYLKPLFYEEYKNMKSIEIAKEVKRRIEEKIEKKLEENLQKQVDK
jgi:1-acyl-sn-glycerol-3-phosphate acyltransferase